MSDDAGNRVSASGNTRGTNENAGNVIDRSQPQHPNEDIGNRITRQGDDGRGGNIDDNVGNY